MRNFGKFCYKWEKWENWDIFKIFGYDLNPHQARVDSWENRLKIREIMDLNFKDLYYLSHNNQLEEGMERYHFYFNKKDID